MPARLRGAVSSFLLEFQDVLNPTTKELFACDASNAGTLIQAARTLLEATSTSESDSVRASLNHVLSLAHSSMASSTRSQLWGWRRIYTDTCILLACADVLDYWVSEDTAGALSAVSHLDHAIVIAGAAGDGRLDLVLDLIGDIQSECLDGLVGRPPGTSTASSLDAPPRTLPQVSTADNAVTSLEQPPSLSSFVSRFARVPFVLRGFVKDWPAITEHPWRSFCYLRSVGGPGRVVPVEVGSDYRSDDWAQQLMPWDEFLDNLQGSQAHPTEPRPVLYLAQHSLFKQFPALLGDVGIPDYVYTSPNAPENYPQYVPPSNEEQLVLNAWLGPAGTVSPAHTDPFFNFYAQVVGRKTIWLAPPEASPHMYPYPSPSTSSPSAASQPHPSHLDSEDRPRNPAVNHESPSMSNTTRVDVFVSSPDEVAKSRADFPAFWTEVVPTAMYVTLEPGDLLFFPPGWWHAMRSEEMSFSVSMWF